MMAETAYNVIQALPEAEKLRLYSMLKLESKEVPPKPKKDDGHWTNAQAKEYILKMHSAKAKRIKNKKPEAATSGFTHQLTTLRSN